MVDGEVGRAAKEYVSKVHKRSISQRSGPSQLRM
jgi:hypothetical protein